MKTLLLLLATLTAGAAYGQNATKIQGYNVCPDVPQNAFTLVWSVTRSCYAPLAPGTVPPTPPADTVKDIKAYGAKCDGSDDTVAIQKALNALESGSLNFSCMASVTQVALQNRENVTVFGTNDGGIKLLTQTSDRWARAFEVRACVSCLIRGLLIEGNDKDMVPFMIEESSNTVVSALTIRNVRQPGAAFASMHNTNNKYLNNKISNVGLSLNIATNDVARGMWIGNVSDDTRETGVTISGNVLTDINGTAIAVHGSGSTITGNTGAKLNASCVKVLPLGGAGQTLVANNNCSGAGAKWQIGGGLMTEYYNASTEVTILRDNILEGYAASDVGRVQESANNGIAVANPAGKLTHNLQIIGNTIRNFMFDSIQISSPYDGLLIEGNLMERTYASGTQWNGIAFQGNPNRQMTNVTMRRNQIRGGKFDGIVIVADGGAMSGITLDTNSIVTTSRNGLHIEVKNGGQITGVSLSGMCYSAIGGQTIWDNRPNPIPPAPQSASCN